MMESSLGGGPPLKWHSFKMILDPQIHAGVRKTVRYDGSVTVPPGGPGGAVTVNPSDPRSKMPPALARWRRLECMELTVPRFKIDENYVGEPPPVEVTVENLNDNVDKTFLERMIRKYGNIEELEIYYHPVRRKHLGLARIVFELVRSAKLCVKELHGKSVMGKQLNCYIDPFFASAKKMYNELTTEKKEEPPPTIINNDQSPSTKRNLNSTTAPYRHDPRNLERRNSYDGERNDERSSYYEYNSQNTTAQHSSSSAHHQQHHSHAAYLQPSLGTPHGGGGGIENHPAYSAMSMDYWQQSSAMYAHASSSQDLQQAPSTPMNDQQEQSTALENSAPPNGGNEKDEGDVTDSNQKMDLDTRLKLLMKKGSGSGLMPAFLLNELNSDEEEKGIPVEDPDKINPIINGAIHNPVEPSLPILSRPPSPFISVEAYEACNMAWQESLRRAHLLSQNINSHVLHADPNNKLVNNGTNSGKRPTSRESDQMSLSSLSSGDDKIMQQQQIAAGVYPTMAATTCLPYPPPPGSGAPFTFPYSGGWGFDPYTQHAWTMHGSVMPPLPGYPPQSIPPPPLPYEADNENETRKNNLNNKINLKDQYRKLLDESVDVFVRDLKRTVRRDMTKKIGETFAFNLYDEWWQSKENEFKRKQISSKQKRTSSTKPLVESNKLINSSSTISDDHRHIPKAEDLTSIFDKQRDLSGVTSSGGSFGAGGSLGFGFRGSIPKLPSFKIKPSSKKRSGSSDDDDDSSRKRDDDYQQRRRRREERHHRRREEEKRRRSKDRQRYSSSQRHRSRSRDKSSSSSKKAKTSSAISSSSKPSRNERRREREIRRDKRRLKDKSIEDDTLVDKIPSSVNKENNKVENLGKEEFLLPSKTKSQTIYTSSSSEDERKEEPKKEDSTVNDKSKKWDKAEKKKGSKKKIVVSSSSDEGEASPGEEKTAPIIEESSSSSEFESSDEKENKVVESKKKSEDPPVLPPPSKKPSTTALATLAKSESSTDSALDDDKQSPPHIIDHCYAAARPKEEPASERSPKKRQNSFAEDFANDHGYTKQPRSPSPTPTPAPAPKQPPVKEKKIKKKKTPNVTAQSSTSSTKVSTKWSLRDPKEQFEVVYRFLTNGLDLEDLRYLKSCYEMMLNQHSNNKNMMWMNDTHWVDHPVTDLGAPPPNKRRRKDDFSKVHTSGSCRTEGYYKMDPREKMRTKYHLHRDPNSFVINKITNLEGAATRGKIVSAQNLSREARNNQRRQLAVLGEDALNSDLLKFNQLKFRRKQMTFGKSAIHDWGLFAMEDIGADEMVIEYVGSVIRPVLSDVRENRYEKQGIGSSYLFRIDSEYVVDATKCGNLARFINHSCDPNCYAKIITIDGEKKIVIYSKQPIAFGEEITYDYKFPIEDEKIRCLCGSKNCRKYLN